MAKQQGKQQQTGKGKRDKPTASERAGLTSKLVALGYRGQDLAAIIRAGRKRKEIADDLIERQRQAPKAQGG